MFEVLQIDTHVHPHRARLACACGNTQLDAFACRGDQIIFCRRCGQLGTRRWLEANRALPLGTVWVNVRASEECPLVNVSLHAQVSFHLPGEATPALTIEGTVTKLSVQKCFVRLHGGTGEVENLARASRGALAVQITGVEPPLHGSIRGRLETVLRPHGPQSSAYHVIAYERLDSRREEQLADYYRSTCGLKDTWNNLLSVQESIAREDAPGVLDLDDTDPGVLGNAPAEIELPPAVTSAEEETVRLICMASETHDPNSSNHLRRIAAYSAAIARQMQWPSRRATLLSIASKLHDIGKIGIPDSILRKTGTLTSDERKIMQQHTRLGHHILRDSLSEVMRLGALIALRHHERYDGEGYPDGLTGEAIPIEAQITSVCDVFDALTTARPYKPAWSREEAVEFVLQQAGRMFTPGVVQAFSRALPEIEQAQQRFLDDFREIWIERRIHPRYFAPPVPVELEVAMPEQTFRPFSLQGRLSNVSEGGLKLVLSGVSRDMFGLLASARRYAKIHTPDTAWREALSNFCAVIWLDYYALPDPQSCLIGLSFQRQTPLLASKVRELAHAGVAFEGQHPTSDQTDAWN